MPSELEGFIFSYFFAENRILGCLGSILEASWTVLAKFLGRLGHPRRFHDALLGPQDGPKTRPRPTQERPKTPPKTHLAAQDRQEPQKLRKWPPKVDGVPLGASFLEPTWVHLGPFWWGFWNTFCTSFWIDVDVNLGYFEWQVTSLARRHCDNYALSNRGWNI